MGLFKRREVLLPTLRGWFLILLIGAGLISIAAYEIRPFLAVTNPTSGGDLVVEGWMPDYALEKAISEFKRNPYRKLYVTGGLIERGASLSGYKTYAELGAAILRSKGMPSDFMQEIPTPKFNKDRTYASALALKDWQREHGVTPMHYHVLSLGAHARRTRLMFEMALGEDAIVGITAIEDLNYDPKRWWNSSAGVRAVIGEVIAYSYSRLLFRQ